MNEHELRDFRAARSPSHNAAKELEGLHCYGCAHSAAMAPPPGMPSGERPCCSCIRNPERDEWAKKSEVGQDAIVIDDQGNARCFNPFSGNAYNGAPYVHWPMDNYVTLDQRDQEDFYEKHPAYGQAISFRDGKPVLSS